MEYGAVEGYATPAKFTTTAVKDNARTLTAEYKTTIVTVNMADNQSSLDDIANATATVAASGITTKTVKTGQSVKVPTGVRCTVTWGALADYKTPSAQTFTTSGTAVAKTGTYQTELVSVTLNADNGASVNGAKVTINGKSHTWNGTAITQKVAFGTTYSVSVGALDGFSTPSAQNNISASQASRSLTFTYIASALKVNILSNQSTESSWDPTITNVKATVTYGSTTLQVLSGQQINIPTDQEVTITFPSVTGYKTPDTIKFTNTNGGVVEKTGTYQTQLLTVNVTYSGTAPSGYTITGKDSGGNVLFTQAVAFATHKIPYGTSYTVSASKLDGYDAVASQSGTANSTSNTITMMYVHNPVKDLSKFDIYGNAISQTTANCYVVSKADTYKIPLVFGNALKNGATNSAAYTKNDGMFSHDFVDFNGTVVTSPYIETVSGTATNAQLSIADTDGIFTDISIVDGSPCRYLQFKVNSIPATGANGVLSIKDSSGVIMWSWHIWVWADSLTTVEITNSTSAKYKILPVNLASKWDDTAKTKIKNWFYQFGRPNPMLCPSSYNSTSNHASFGVLSYAAASIASNIQTGIKNPATFYKYSSSYNYNWFQTNSGKTYNLWDAACTSTGNSDNNVVKTIYDPCPIGFKMPNGNTFTGFSIINDANGIVKFTRYSGDSTGVGFPMSGYRLYSGGSLSGVGSVGYVWLSSAYSQGSAYYLLFYSSDVYPQNYYYRANGFSVRPVQE